MRNFENDSNFYGVVFNNNPRSCYSEDNLVYIYSDLILKHLSNKSKKEKTNKYDENFDYVNEIYDGELRYSQIDLKAFERITKKITNDKFLLHMMYGLIAAKNIEEYGDDAIDPELSNHIDSFIEFREEFSKEIHELLNKEEKPMNNIKSKIQQTANKVVNIVKSDTFNAGKRALSNQFFKTAKVTLQEVLKKNLNKISNEHVKSILTFILQSDIGDSVLKIGVGSIMPHISVNITKPITSAVAEELRIQGYQGLFDKLSDTMIDPIRKIIKDSFSEAIPKVYPELIQVKENAEFKVNSSETVKENRKSN